MPFGQDSSGRSARRSMGFLVALFVLVCGLFMAIGAYFAYDTLLKAERQAVESRFALATQRVAVSAERGASYGVALAAQTTLSEVLAREAALDPAIRSFDVVDTRGKILFSSDTARAGQPSLEDDTRRVTQPIRDDLGNAVGLAQIRFERRFLNAAAPRLAAAILAAAWPAVLLACLLTLAGGWWLSRQVLSAIGGGATARRLKWLYFGFRGSLSVVAGIALALSLGLFTWQAQPIGETEILPDLQQKARSVARASAALIEFALAADIPLAELQGVPEHFASLRASSPEIATLELLDGQGRVLHRGGRSDLARGATTVSEPVMAGAQAVATLKVTVDDQVIGNQLRATLVDIGFLAVVSLLIALELMALLIGGTASRHLAALEGQLATVRAAAAGVTEVSRASESAQIVRPALFLFMLAEELTRPFLPGHSRSLVVQSGGNVDLLGSLPLVVFLATVALCQIPFASLSLRLGRREGFAGGAVLAALGYALCGWTSDLAWFTFARLLSGAGFALVFVSAQGQVIDGSTPSDRARSLAIFIRAILVAGLCGPPLGGMIADRWGVSVTFQVCAVLSLLAMVAVTLSLPARDKTRSPPWASGLRDLPEAWRAPGVRPLLLGCALPAKLILGALCFYLVPLYLQKTGYSGAEIGRLLMIYPLMMVVAVPAFAALADRLGQRRLFVIFGGMLAGGCTLLVLIDLSPLWIGLMLFLMGVGQSMSITPQSAIMADLSADLNGRQSAGVLGLFRLVERSGSAVGPAVGAVLLGSLGFGVAVATIGLAVIAGNAAYAVFTRRAVPARLPS